MTDELNSDQSGSFQLPARRVAGVEVDGLFGLYDHRIPLNTKDRVTILHGPNGIGKTILLRLISSLFAGRYTELAKIPFKQFRVRFENGDLLTLWHGETKRKSGEILMARFAARGQSPQQDGVVVSPNAEIPIEHIIMSNIHWLERVGAEMWHDQRRGDFIQTLEAWDRYRPRLSSRQQKLFEEPEWLTQVRRHVSVHLIETQRLVRLLPGRRDEPGASSVATVQHCANELAKRIAEQIQAYGREVQTLDPSFPQRLLRKPSPLSVDKIKQQMAELDQEQERLRSLDLLVERQEERLAVGSLDSLDQTQRTVMTLYIEDTRKKLSVLSSLARRIELLLKQLSKLKNKKFSVDAKRGLVVTVHDNIVLPLEALSSGEQHEIVLFYDLLFRVPENALVLVDEPELSLHIEWQKTVLLDLLAVVGEVHFDVLLATHSIFIAGDRPDLMVGLQG